MLLVPLGASRVCAVSTQAKSSEECVTQSVSVPSSLPIRPECFSHSDNVQATSIAETHHSLCQIDLISSSTIPAITPTRTQLICTSYTFLKTCTTEWRFREACTSRFAVSRVKFAVVLLIGMSAAEEAAGLCARQHRQLDSS